MKSEMETFRTTLSTHIMTINMLLAHYDIQQTSFLRDDATVFHTQVRGQLQHHTNVLGMVQTMVPAQVSAMHMVQSSLGIIETSVNGDLQDSCRAIQETATEIW